MGLSPIPSGANTLNVLTAQTIMYDDELIPNLKGETDAFTSMAVRRNQGKGVGFNRTLVIHKEGAVDTDAFSLISTGSHRRKSVGFALDVRD